MTASMTIEELWAAVVGQPRAVEAMRAAAVRPVHAYLLVGPAGSGKRAAARAFAAELLGADAADGGADPSRAVELAGSERHPDLHVFEPEGAGLSVADAEAIIVAASRSPLEGRRKVLLLEQFHTIDVAGPKLLKTIEEPPESTVFVILADEVPNELVAIASRAVRIDFGPVPATAIVDRLVAEGVSAADAEVAAAASGGDLRRARLLVSDRSLRVRRDSWASIPHRIDGTGHTAALLVDEVLSHIDEAQFPLDERHQVEREALEAEVAEHGLRRGVLKELETRHKREIRRHRTAELRFGLGVLAGEFRDRLATGGDAAAVSAAVSAIGAASEALLRNPNELLLLQALVVGLPRG